MSPMGDLFAALETAAKAYDHHWRMVRPNGLGRPGPWRLGNATPEWRDEARKLSRALLEADEAFLADLTDNPQGT
jgi:hypothetical protein